MNVKQIVSMALLAVSFTDAHAISRIVSGTPILPGYVIKGVQYINRGSKWQDLDDAPYVLEIDREDDYYKLFEPGIAHPDSMYIIFVPGDLIAVRISASATWIDSSECYEYQYELYSQDSSRTPIRGIDMPRLNDHLGTTAPNGWSFLIRFTEPIYSCHANTGEYYLKPNENLTGIDIASCAPPTLGNFVLYGNSTYDPEGIPEEEEIFGDVYTQIAYEHRGVEIASIVPGPAPEQIEPVQWVYRLFYSRHELERWGYLESQAMEGTASILMNLAEMFKVEENQKLTVLEQEVNNAIAELEQYQEQMEPEAQAFIFENLRYLLRHLDIVKFKEYP